MLVVIVGVILLSLFILLAVDNYHINIDNDFPVMESLLWIGVSILAYTVFKV